MEELRNIIKEELSKLMEGRLDALNSDFDKMINDPKHWADKMAEWQQKARMMNQFYWEVSGIIGAPNMSCEKKMAQINQLLPHYGWV